MIGLPSWFECDFVRHYCQRAEVPEIFCQELVSTHVSTQSCDLASFSRSIKTDSVPLSSSIQHLHFNALVVSNKDTTPLGRCTENMLPNLGVHLAAKYLVSSPFHCISPTPPVPPFQYQFRPISQHPTYHAVPRFETAQPTVSIE
jgi:hypothetical protein